MAVFAPLILLGISVLAPLFCWRHPRCLENYQKIAGMISNIEISIEDANTATLPQNSRAYQPSSNTTTSNGTYDYIIVGGSATGCVLANRLTEDPDVKVLLLEAGGSGSEFGDIPGMSLFLLGSDVNWKYNTTQQRHCCLGTINRTCPYPTAKALGGYTQLSAPVYTRGNRLDYDRWCSEEGCHGWCYSDVLPYFITAENSQINGTLGYHGVGGPMNVEYLNSSSYGPQYYAFITANMQMGRSVVDYNGPQQLGVSPIQFNTINGSRLSAEEAYLTPAANRPNLVILPMSYCTKILFQESFAYGVAFSREGSLFEAYALKDIIMSSGAVRSAQLLMLSGIGPAHHLTSLGIPVVQDLPVGHNLQNPVVYYPLNFRTNYTQAQNNMQTNVEDYLSNAGPFTASGNQQGIGFYQTRLENVPGYPDIQLIMVPSNNSNPFFQKAWHYTDATYAEAYGGNDPTTCFSIYIQLLHPRSRGEVTLTSSNPYSYPRINPRCLSDFGRFDLETIYQGILLAIQIANQPAFQDLSTTLIKNTPAACKNLVYLSKAYWYCCIEHYALPVVNSVGTCKMGTVVDHTTRVKGVHGLKVVDASIIPSCTSGDFGAPLVMIGEKVADMIKNEH